MAYNQEQERLILQPIYVLSKEMWVIMAYVILLFKNLSFAKLLKTFCGSVSLMRGKSERIERKFITKKIQPNTILTSRLIFGYIIVNT